MSDSVLNIPSAALASPEPLLQSRFRALEGPAKPTPAQLKRIAQDFEGILLEKLLQEMQNTIPDSELFSSPGMEQMQSLFWSFLSEQVAQNGGIGLAQNLYRDLCRSAGVSPTETAALPETRELSSPRSSLAKYREAAQAAEKPEPTP